MNTRPEQTPPWLNYTALSKPAAMRYRSFKAGIKEVNKKDPEKGIKNKKIRGKKDSKL
jgi:hypothetical protein